MIFFFLSCDAFSPSCPHIQSKFYTYQATMVVDQHTQYDQHHPAHFPDVTTNIHHLWNNGIICYIVAHNLLTLYIHHAAIVVYCTKYEQNQPEIMPQQIQIQDIYNTMAVITPILHRTKYCVTCISKISYLITVPNLNKITTFFFDISQQTNTSNQWKKITMLNQIWKRAKVNCMCIINT